MKPLKVLNLYCGIGGNRKLWRNVEVTAVENNPDIAKIYQDFFPEDKVIVGDAHKYLLEHFEEFDFIWSSPPCPTHSQFRHRCGVKAWNLKPVYPDMRLYQEIILLKHHFKGVWVVENTEPYYEPLIKPYKAGRHFFWSNFYISDCDSEALDIKKHTKEDLYKMHGFDLSKFEIKDKRTLLRNCVNPKLGLHVFRCAFKTKQVELRGVI